MQVVGVGIMNKSKSPDRESIKEYSLHRKAVFVVNVVDSWEYSAIASSPPAAGHQNFMNEPGR
jgi:hypothetical protein